MDKEVPDIEDVGIISFANYGDGWSEVGNLINYQY